MALYIELDDVDMFDSDLAESIINNTRRYSNLLSDLIYDLLPAYKVKEVGTVQIFNFSYDQMV